MIRSTTNLSTNAIAMVGGGNNPMPGEKIAEAINYRNLDRSDCGTTF